MAVLLELRGVHAAYGGIAALRGIDLRVDQGEIVALLGANGAGKTTTLRCVMGLVPLSDGTVLFRDDDLAGLTTDRRAALGLSLVPEGRAIFPNLTVRENLEIGAYARRDARAMRASLDDVIRLFPRLGERMRQDGGTLSGGEQQMLAIGRALMGRPSLLLLDEPSLGIAPKLVEQVFEAISRIAASGMTILLVEQNAKLSLATSARAYVLRAGEVVTSGASKTLASDPVVQAAYLGG